MAADMFSDDLPGGFDVRLWSHVLQDWGKAALSRSWSTAWRAGRGARRRGRAEDAVGVPGDISFSRSVSRSGIRGFDLSEVAIGVACFCPAVNIFGMKGFRKKPGAGKPDNPGEVAKPPSIWTRELIPEDSIWRRELIPEDSILRRDLFNFSAGKRKSPCLTCPILMLEDGHKCNRFDRIPDDIWDGIETCPLYSEKGS